MGCRELCASTSLQKKSVWTLSRPRATWYAYAPVGLFWWWWEFLSLISVVLLLKDYLRSAFAFGFCT
jgi:hypothetical protein